VDVREDDHFHGELIPGAIRMPWGQFRTTDPVVGVGGVFVGANQAQTVLGRNGITRSDTIILYDSVERDGGATASYLFWVLELLGHQNVKMLNGGIDAWKRAGLETTKEPVTREPQLYQAPPEELKPRKWIRGEELYQRLNDPYCQILDVRSSDEYLGEKPNTDWRGRVLKLGHVPGAFNVNYQRNWVDEKTKLIKPYAKLQQLYPGLNPHHAVVTYCHSARRSSFSYFIFRLMGFNDVRLYDYSWNEWGKKSLFYPVETTENILSGPLPGTSTKMKTEQADPSQTRPPERSDSDSGSSSEYISCGG
jgi:thiosulfate/3-mercaptopyruvate sulfurtransferase